MKNGKYAADTKRKRMPRIWLIAAIIAAMVFLMGCAWIILRMQDMKLGDETLYYDVFDDEGFVGREPVEMEVLTFAGVKGSPSYQAAKEWFDFLHEYLFKYLFYGMLFCLWLWWTHKISISSREAV